MLRYEVASSDGTGSYTVRIEGAAGSVRMFCTCAAGENGSYCKHRFNLLDGVVTSVIVGDIQQLGILKEWLPGSSLEAALKERTAAEKEAEMAKRRLKKANLMVAEAMRAG